MNNDTSNIGSHFTMDKTFARVFNARHQFALITRLDIKVEYDMERAAWTAKSVDGQVQTTSISQDSLIHTLSASHTFNVRTEWWESNDLPLVEIKLTERGFIWVWTHSGKGPATFFSTLKSATKSAIAAGAKGYVA